MNSTTMTVRLEFDIKERLTKLAEATHRSRSYLATQAINEYLKTQEWLVSEIQKGIVEADTDQLIDHASILEFWVKKKN